MTISGLAPLLGAALGLIVWAMHFGIVYGAVAIVCARGAAQPPVLGLPVLPLLVVGASVLALAALAPSAWHALRGPMEMSPDEEGASGGVFLARLEGAVTGLAALAIVWETLPALFFQACR